MSKKLKKRIFLSLGILSAGAVAFVVISNRLIDSSAEGKIYSDVKLVPENRVALVLGTAPKVGQTNWNNVYFTGRMQAAAALYKAGKVEKILVSGDNSRVEYDEPTAMKESLMKLGVPETAIGLDYAGFRTLDSIVRARKIFGLDRMTIVTDDFHLPRSLYIAQHAGIEAVGFQSRSLPVSTSPRTWFRESGARLLIMLDLHLFNRQPKFLGKRETI